MHRKLWIPLLPVLIGAASCARSAPSEEAFAKSQSAVTTNYITPGVGSFVDASGNVYTIDAAGNADENGSRIPGGGGTSAMEYADGVVYGQDATTGQWYTWNQVTWTPSSAPPTPTAPATPGAPYITPGMGTFTDASGNVYAIDSAGNAEENGGPIPGGGGTSAMEYYNGQVYGQDSTTGDWYTWDQTNWNGPVTAPPAPSGPPPVDAGTGSNDAGIGHPDAGPPPADAGNQATGTPITAPLSGSVNPGTWQAGDINVPGVALPSGKAFHYNYLLPANYDPSFTYPILVHEHEDEEGDAWYDGQNGDPLYLASASGADSWYNNTAWRTAYPCIIILPYADQTANGTDGDDAVENFGGWVNTGVTGTGTTFSGDSGPNVFAVAGLAQSFIQNYSVNPSKVYITGDSLGGIGSWYMMLMYNRVNGPSGKLFTAGLPFAGVLEIHGYGAGPSGSDVTELRNVPIFAVSGANDTTSNPQDWNQPLWADLAGNTNYPAPPSGAEAGNSAYHYMQDPNLGHDVWDTYRLLPAGQPMYDWLFSQ
jgi:hypothetical protein